MGLDEQDNHIRIRGPCPSGRDHRPIQTAARPKQTRRVDKNNLAVALKRHTTNTRAGGLHLMGHN